MDTDAELRVLFLCFLLKKFLVQRLGNGSSIFFPSGEPTLFLMLNNHNISNPSERISTRVSCSLLPIL